MFGEWIDFSQFVEEHVMYVHVPLNARVFFERMRGILPEIEPI